MNCSTFCKILSSRNISGIKKLNIYFKRYLATLIDGKKVAADIHKELQVEINELVKSGHRVPHLVLVRVGDDVASSIYVRNKMNAAQKIGIKSTVHHLPASTLEKDVLNLIQELNLDKGVDGILIQLPLPEHFKEKELCQEVLPVKDVDGFHIYNIGRFCLDMPCLGPCTPLGVVELIKHYEIPTFGKHALVCGRSKNVGMPIAMLLHGDGVRLDASHKGMDATTTICHRYTPPEELKRMTMQADIIVTAAGVPNLITGNMIKDGCAILDVGMNRISDPITGKVKLVGDCHFESCVQVAKYITPVPGGVGPMTVAMLMKNTITAAKLVQLN